MNYRYHLILLLFIFLFADLSCSKSKIQPASIRDISYKTDSRVNDIICLSDSYWVAVGGIRYTQALILESFDCGKNWIEQPYIADKEIYDVLFKNGVGFAVGLDGKVFKRSINDSVWTYTQTIYWDVNKSFDYADDNNGYIVGGSSFGYGFMIKIDGDGNVSTRDTFANELDCINFCTALIGYVSGYGTVLKTIDGGQNWELLTIEGDYFKSIYCQDENTIWVVGYEGTIASSYDGGISWHKYRNSNGINTKKYRLNKIVFQDDLRGYIVGDNGLMLLTNNGGGTWNAVEKFTDKDLYSIAITKKGETIVAGEAGTIFSLSY